MSSVSPAPKRVLPARRLALLASVAGLGAALAFGAADVRVSPVLNGLVAPAHAESAQRPVGFADIVEKVKPAVISVRVKMNAGPENSEFSDQDNPFGPNSPFRYFFRRFGQQGPGNIPGLRGQLPRRQFTTGQGSGFFISADGYAVTNNHVVDKAESVEVTSDDGKTHTAKVIGTDSRTDLALIKVEGGSNFPFVRLADQAPRVGDWVLAVGNPFGLGGTVTAGIVSARGRDIGAGPYDDFIQIDAPVNKGNSGGPTFDVDGNVIGVNTAIFSPSGGSVGIAFAIPAETVKTVVGQLKEHGKVTRGWIGVQIQPVTADIAESLGLKQARGALVAEPQDGSPAAKAGIKSGDVIVSLNGDPVPDARSLARRISGLAPGTSVKIGIVRSGNNQDLSLTLGELPKERVARADGGDHGQDGDLPRLGLSLAPAANVNGAGDQGVVVTQVDPDGAAAAHGFKTGDVILEIGGKSVNAPADVRKALNQAKSDGKRTVLMRVKSDQGTRFVAIPVGNA
ncbi:MAG TPA: Do family serine endopeptidase [Xanthobacteraceae bacterium]|nr:Do family serine endopeptidase [Xanthobacteraceae bacterium]